MNFSKHNDLTVIERVPFRARRMHSKGVNCCKKINKYIVVLNPKLGGSRQCKRLNEIDVLPDFETRPECLFSRNIYNSAGDFSPGRTHEPPSDNSFCV